MLRKQQYFILFNFKYKYYSYTKKNFLSLITALGFTYLKIIQFSNQY